MLVRESHTAMIFKPKDQLKIDGNQCVSKTCLSRRGEAEHYHSSVLSSNRVGEKVNQFFTAVPCPWMNRAVSSVYTCRSAAKL